jgi:hypothetical protein
MRYSSVEEVQIRAATVVSVEMIMEEVRKRREINKEVKFAF